MRLFILMLSLVACARAPVETGAASSSSCSKDSDCPTGFRCDENSCKVKGLSAQSVDLRAPECQSCKKDADCGDDGRAGCWITNALGAFAYCGFDCTTTACPAGMVCQPDAVGDTRTCWPAAGACPSSPDDAVCTDDNYAGFAQPFFATNCVGCHEVMGTFEGVQKKAADIRKVVDAGTMPPKNKLAPEVALQLTSWIDCGMKQ